MTHNLTFKCRDSISNYGENRISDEEGQQPHLMGKPPLEMVCEFLTDREWNAVRENRVTLLVKHCIWRLHTGISVASW